MHKDDLATRLKRQGAVYNGWLHIPSAFTADLMVQGGYDAVTLDMQHGPIDDAAMFEMLSTLARSDALAFARVAGNNPAAIMRLLDAGAEGIICPLVNSADECRTFVEACHYPPKGMRSWGPTRARVAYGTYDPKVMNERVATFAMIETGEGFAALDAIAATPGLTGLFVGPADLSFALKGDPSVDFGWPPLVEVLEHIVQACREHDLVPAIFTASAVEAARVVELGYRFVTVGADSILLQRKVHEELQQLRTPDA